MSSLALDVGGSYIKAARIRAGSVFGPVIRRPIPDFVDTGLNEEAREIDPIQLDSAVFAVLNELGIEDIRSHDVFVSGQMAGLAFVGADGHAVRNIISWQDTRYQDTTAITGALTSSQMADLGDGLRVGSPAVTLAAHGVPEDSFPTSLIAYVAGRLAGSRATRIHVTDAGAWGLFDTRNLCWSQAACAATGIDTQLLPSVRVHVEPINDGSRVFTGVGDQQAALLGAGICEGVVSVNLATGCQVSILGKKFHDRVQTRPYFGEHYLHTVTHLPAGRLLTSALEVAHGGTDSADWESVWSQAQESSVFLEAVEVVVAGICDAVKTLDVWGHDVVFSGGLIQRSEPLLSRLLSELEWPAHKIFPGNDASLSGLAVVEAALAKGPP